MQTNEGGKAIWHFSHDLLSVRPCLRFWPQNYSVSSSLSVFPLEIPPGSTAQFTLGVNFHDSSLILIPPWHILAEREPGRFLSYPPSLIVGGEALRLDQAWPSGNSTSGAYLAVANLSSGGRGLSIARRIFYVGVRLSNASELPPPEEWPGQPAGKRRVQGCQLLPPFGLPGRLHYVVVQLRPRLQRIGLFQGRNVPGQPVARRRRGEQRVPRHPIHMREERGAGSYAYVCVLPTLAVAAFAFFALLKSSGAKRKKRARL